MENLWKGIAIAGIWIGIGISKNNLDWASFYAMVATVVIVNV
jgi:hypothetical protein